jgi:hypothetical protein
MKSHVLANDEVHLQFGQEEHIALSRSLYYLLMTLRPEDVERVLGMPGERAYDFVYDIYASEVLARGNGIAWIPGAEFDATDGAGSVNRSLPVTFTDEGSEWRLTLEELWLVQSCANEVARRAS